MPERVSTKKSLMTKLFDKIKSIDMYGKDISLTYDGDDKYRTYIGGVSSLFVGSIIITYVVYLFYIMFYKQDTSVATTGSINDIFNDVKVHKPAQNKFDFAISLVANGVDYIQDTTAFTVELNQVVQEWDSTSQDASFTRTKTPLTFEKCGTTNFNYDNVAEVQRIGIDDFYCPTSDNYSVAGSFYAKSFHYLELKVKKCTGSASCKTDAAINTIMADSRFSLALVNSLVNFDNYGDPIEQIIDDGNYWELTAGFRKKSDLFIRYNVGNFEDEYFQLGFESQKDFYQVIDTKDRFEAESSSGDVLSIYFRVDKATSEYGRKIFSLGELMGLAGGFYGSLLTIGSFFITVFADKLYVAALLGRIYKIDTNVEKEHLTGKTKVNPIEQKDLYSKDSPSSMADSKALKFRDNLETCKQEMGEDPEWNNTERNKLLEKCEKSMKERRPFTYGYYSIFQHFMCCVSCKGDKKIRRRPELRRHAYFNVGKDKLARELDCVTLIKAIKQLKILTQVLLSREQKFLIKYQRQNIIPSASSGSSDDEKNVIQENKNGKKGYDGYQSRNHSKEHEDITQIIQAFRNKDLDDVDLRIINGIFRKESIDKNETKVVSPKNANKLVSQSLEELKKGSDSDRNMPNLEINQLEQVYYGTPPQDSMNSGRKDTMKILKSTPGSGYASKDNSLRAINIDGI
ncbi:unnamed protein product [Moneuplotes crassus]|uniref:Uncharacterized protein n=1 Tax=Euplotes crassus TaxID=5936 RepID=A0AAD1YAX0_EUPCR|nr:unnamed protein product [Moneuplotes crassus]